MPSRRATVVAVAAVAVIALVAVLVVRFWDTARKTFADPDVCTVGSYELDPSQASVAATMVGAVTKYRIKLPARAAVLVLGAALQESKLINVPPGDGDRDSVGVLQQRPSQGWGGGSAAVLTDVGEATKEFLDAMIKVPNWQTRQLADVVQAVQISADGSLYAQHEGEAQALADALLGREAAAISCTFEKPTQVAAAATVAQQASKELGIDTPRAVGTSVRVPGAGWQTAAWFVANADRLGIEQVGYAGKQWSRADGWKTSAAPSTQVVATMYSAA